MLRSLQAMATMSKRASSLLVPIGGAFASGPCLRSSRCTCASQAPLPGRAAARKLLAASSCCIVSKLFRDVCCPLAATELVADRCMRLGAARFAGVRCTCHRQHVRRRTAHGPLLCRHPAARAAGGLAVPHADIKDGKRFNSPDDLIESSALAPGNSEEKRAFTYFVLVRARVRALACDA